MANPRAMILCIDDDELGLEARKELLEISGYDVLTACSGQEALGLFASHRVDAVMVDYQMPEMSGDRVASEMKRVKAHVPILMLSAYDDLPGSKLTHVDAFVCKSESWPKVLSSLDRLLQGCLPFFDRWWESWKYHRYHTGNSQMVTDSGKSHPGR
jgi:CheY-like chemotaxis protein